MKKIEHYMLPENTNRLYEEEAISSIGLTRDVADKINELVDAINMLSTTDLEWKQTQEGTIRKAIIYIKDNLVNTLNDLLELNGTKYMNREIKRYTTELEERVDEILKLETVDGELIDARFGEDSVSYATAGEAIRAQMHAIKEQVSSLFNALNFDEVVVADTMSGYIDANYELHAPQTTQKEITTDFIPMGKNDVFYIKTMYTYPTSGKAWIGVTYYDAYRNPLERSSEEDITEKLIVNNIENATYFTVSTRTYGDGTMVVLKKNLDKVSSTIPVFQHKYDYEYQKLNLHLGYYNSKGEILAPSAHGAEMSSDLVPVAAGQKYALISNAVNKVGIVGNHAGYLWSAVAFYDTDGQFLYRPYSYTATEEREDKTYSLVGEFTIPAGVGFIRVMSRTYWNGTINLAIKRDIISSAANAISFENMCSGVKGIAHRGYSSGAPENTIPAYKLAKQNGFYYVETDVRFTNDNVPVCIHDATINRTSSGNGTVSGMTLAQLKALDFGSWFSSEYVGTSIPTFEELISLCKKIGLHLYIELKEGTKEQIEGLVELVKSYGMLDKVTWIGGSPMNQYITPIYPKARIGLVVSQVTEANVAEAARLLTGNNEVFMDSQSYTENEIALCKAHGVGLEVWTINKEDTIINLPPYVSGVTSDTYHAGIVLYENA